MAVTPNPSGPETEVLDTHDCWKSLRSASVGRLAVTTQAGPEIFPVNYVPGYGTVVFRTGPGTKLEAALAGPVALEADGLNAYGTIAWSVVVKGTAKVVDTAEDFQEAAEAGLAPWEPGSKDHLVRITPSDISGRRFVITPPGSWWPPVDAQPEAAPESGN